MIFNIQVALLWLVLGLRLELMNSLRWGSRIHNIGRVVNSQDTIVHRAPTSTAMPRKREINAPPLNARGKWEPPLESPESALIADSTDIVYEIELPKRAGIDWGCDLSFRWVYVINLDPAGEAYKSGVVQKGDYIVAVGNVSTVAQDFDFVLTALTKYPENKMNYTFFRGSKEKLVGGPVLAPSDILYKVIVKQSGKPDLTIDCPGGTNLRRLLVGNGINVYRSISRWTNCNGKQRCGTCIVDIESGIEGCSRKSIDEDAVLRENPETYRLSCITSVYSDVTVVVQGPVGAAQWTR